jgi:hypothetical protein
MNESITLFHQFNAVYVMHQYLVLCVWCSAMMMCGVKHRHSASNPDQSAVNTHVPSLLRIACVRTISKFAADRTTKCEAFRKAALNMLLKSVYVYAYD